MPKAPTPCLNPTCYEYTLPGASYCPQHIPPPFHTSTRKSRLPRDWKTRRTIVMKRHKGICHICGQPGADTIDHIIPNDDHSLDNLAPAHDRTPPHCHRYKTAQEAVKVRQQSRPSPKR